MPKKSGFFIDALPKYFDFVLSKKTIQNVIMKMKNTFFYYVKKNALLGTNYNKLAMNKHLVHRIQNT